MRILLYSTALLLLNSAPLAFGEIKMFNGPLAATSSLVQYSTSYLFDPGSIDLTKVTFTVTSTAALNQNDDNRYHDDTPDDGDDDTDNDDDEKIEPNNRDDGYYTDDDTDGDDGYYGDDKGDDESESDDGAVTDDGKNDDVGTDDGNTDDSITDRTKTDDGVTDDGKSDDGKSDDGKSDDGKSDDDKTDDGASDDGKTDDGASDDGVSDDGVSDDGESDDGVTEGGESDDGVTDDDKTDDDKTDDDKTDDDKTDDDKTDDDKTDDDKTDDGASDDGASDDGVTDDGKTDDGESDDGVTEGGKSDDGVTDDGVTDDGKTDDGKSDDGVTDDGKTDDGESDDGKTDDGKTDDGVTDDGESDDGESDDGESDDGKTDDNNVGNEKSEDDDNENDDYYEDEEDDDGKTDDNNVGNEEDDDDDNDNDDYYNDDDEDEGKSDDGNRQLTLKEYTIDILFFREPTDCAKRKDGCDWTKLGIGSSDDLGNLRWCCSEDAIELGLCSSDQYGKMIIDADKYKGDHRFVSIPADGEFTGTVYKPIMRTSEGTGQYSLIMANCDDNGRDVEIDGQYVWKSKGGYLPGSLFDDWHFVIFSTLCYVGLFTWYLIGMKKNSESTIGIQKWILATIALGLVETFFQTSDYTIWNHSGFRSYKTMYMWICLGVLRGAISRCLLIMVSLGWGVIRDTLGDQMKKIVLLGAFYLVMAFSRDVAEIVFVEEFHVISDAQEDEIYDVFTLFTLITAAIDVMCYMWILDALNGTMQYLENMNQSMKLRRYLRLRLVLLLSILFGLFWTLMVFFDSIMDTAILAENQDWVISAAWSVNYFFILTSIAYLWRPNPNAKQFAYVMELPSVGGDLDFDTDVGTIGLDDEGDIRQTYSGSLQDDENGMNINNAVAS